MLFRSPNGIDALCQWEDTVFKTCPRERPTQMKPVGLLIVAVNAGFLLQRFEQSGAGGTVTAQPLRLSLQIGSFKESIQIAPAQSENSLQRKVYRIRAITIQNVQWRYLVSETEFAFRISTVGRIGRAVSPKPQPALANIADSLNVEPAACLGRITRHSENGRREADLSFPMLPWLGKPSSPMADHSV